MLPFRITMGVRNPRLLGSLAVFVTILTFGQDSPVLQGSWVATAGESRTFRGRWIGQALPGQPDVLQGSWTLSDEFGKTQAWGTWSARRRGQTWAGTWSAQDQNRRQVSGTWKAEGGGTGGRNLQQLMERTLSTEVSGSWQSGRLQGYWWLKGSQSSPRNP